MNKLAEQINDYLRYSQIERGLSPNTIAAYKQDLLEFLAFVKEEQMPAWPLEAVEIDAFLAKERDLGKANSSISRLVSTLSRFYQWLVRQQLIALDPMSQIDAPKREKRMPLALTEAEVGKLLEQPDLTTDLGIRDRALVELLYATGMRVSEVSGLTLPQIDLDLKTILVHGKGNKDRYVAFDDRTKNSLLNYLNNARPRLLKDKDEQHVFLSNQGKAISDRGIQYVMQKTFNQAGISGKVHPHELRHTFATAMLNNGADMRSVQELLGHSSLSATQIYTHVTTAHLKSDYEKYFPRNKES